MVCTLADRPEEGVMDMLTVGFFSQPVTRFTASFIPVRCVEVG
jgi:hypothetical protein